MSAFLVAVSFDGASLPPLAERLLHAASALPRSDILTTPSRGVTVLVRNESIAPVTVLRSTGDVDQTGAVGMIRLDSSTVPATDSSTSGSHQSDGEPALATLIEMLTHHRSALATVSGEFSAVCWQPRLRRVMALRDPFGVRPLYVRTIGNSVLISSRAALLVNSLDVNLRYIADYLALGYGRSPECVYEGVRALRPAELLQWSGSTTALSSSTYWKARPQPAYERMTFPDAAEEWRRLFFQSVSDRMLGKGRTWSQLSGGLDSSSIVVTAHTLSKRGPDHDGLGGLISYTDELGNSDERVYQNAVTSACRLPHHAIHCHRYWRDDGLAPPLTDQPTITYPMYARDRELVRRITDSGGTVMLSGHGGDHVTDGSLSYLSDYLCRGKWVALIRESMRTAMEGKSSIWRVLRSNALAPLVPARLRDRVRGGRARHLMAVSSEFARRYAMSNLDSRYLVDGGPLGAKWVTGLLTGLTDASETVHRDLCDDALDVRYPFLYPPLVELAISVPPQYLMRGTTGRLLLRAAMQGLLPESVRTRRSKGGFGPQLRWALLYEQSVIANLLHDPLLADLGCVNPRALARMVAAVREGRSHQKFALLAVLSLETWLRVRSGQWKVCTGRMPQHLSHHHKEVA